MRPTADGTTIGGKKHSLLLLRKTKRNIFHALPTNVGSFLSLWGMFIILWVHLKFQNKVLS